ncbi:MAG TPA: carbon storage regulator [Pirellulales bacterium]
MLVLSRKQGQSIVIAQDIVISIMNVGHGRVQIGVTAPPHVLIHRDEVHQRIQQEERVRGLASCTNDSLLSADEACVAAL